MNWYNQVKSFFSRGTASVISLLGFGRKQGYPAETFSNYVNLGFNSNPIAYACVDKRASAISALKWYVTDKNGNEVTNRQAQEILNLLSRPNQVQIGSQFMYAIQATKDLSGNAFIYINTGGGRTPVELQLLRPDAIRIEVDEFGLPTKYVYTTATGTFSYTPDQIIHLPNFSPTSAVLGQSVMSPAWKSISIYNSGLDYSKSTLDDCGKVGGILKNSKPLTKAQTEDMHAKLATYAKGNENYGKDLVLSAGFDYINNTQNAQEMSFIEGMNSRSREIALVFGVPSMLLNIAGDNTYANYETAVKAFYQQTVFAQANVLRDYLNTKLVPLFDRNLVLHFDEDQIQPLSDVRDSRLAAYDKISILSVNERREALGYEPVNLPDANVPAMPSNLIPMGQSVETNE